MQENFKQKLEELLKNGLSLAEYVVSADSWPFLFLKFFFSFSGALYLLGFSFNGANVFGFIDPFIPFERVLCFCASVFLGVYSLVNLKTLIGGLKLEIQKE